MIFKRSALLIAIAIFLSPFSIFMTGASAAIDSSTPELAKMPVIYPGASGANGAFVDRLVGTLISPKKTNHDGIYNGPEVKAIIDLKRNFHLVPKGVTPNGIIGNAVWNVFATKFEIKILCAKGCDQIMSPSPIVKSVVRTSFGSRVTMSCLSDDQVSLRVANQSDRMSQPCSNGKAVFNITSDRFGSGSRVVIIWSSNARTLAMSPGFWRTIRL